jgi:ubiquinone/menaquinone biosynthesis C-methylase UbiE
MAWRVSRTQDAADVYSEERFGISDRMSRLSERERDFAKSVVDRLGENPAIADIPCGDGRFTDIFVKAGASLHSFDYAETMLNSARDNHPDIPREDFKQADITNIPLEDGSVDLVFCMRLIHHIEEDQFRRDALSEMSRVTRKYVATSFYCTGTWRYWRRKLRGKKPSGRAIPSKVLLDEARAVGLHVIETRPSFPYWEQQRLLLFEKKA